MRDRLIIPMILFILIIAISGFQVNDIVEAGPVAQQPTGNIPTVTSTPRGPYVIVNALTANDTQINVRAGPSALTEKVGVLLIDQEANALGRYGDWIQIEYVGAADGKAWVYGNLVTLFGGNLPIVDPPPTSTPNITQTVDPTLAAQFIITPESTRLPTFTEPPPLDIPTYTSATENIGVGGVPMGLIIIGLGALGIFLGVIALISGR
ncbi:MAG: SH3 domain-containing protein [Chloroflexota bacterium]|nr:SH3 domain-containing protein [Chloroflexota bacterium]